MALSAGDSFPRLGQYLYGSEPSEPMVCEHPVPDAVRQVGRAVLAVRGLRRDDQLAPEEFDR